MASSIMQLCESITAHLGAVDAGDVLTQVPFSLFRQQDVETEIRNKVAKQSACGLVYPIAAQRDDSGDTPYMLGIRVDIFSNKILPHDKPPAADIAEAVAARLDRWIPANGLHGHERLRVTGMELVPDEKYLVWQILVSTTRYIEPENS